MEEKSPTTMEESPAAARAVEELGRRGFLAKLAAIGAGGLVLGGLSNAMAGGRALAAGATATSDVPIAALPELPPAVAGEDVIVRMTEDLQRALKKPAEQRRWGMVIDLRRCVGCQSCTVACIVENKLPPGVVYRVVLQEDSGSYPNVGRTFTPRPCMQCDNPPCVPVCPVGATYKRPDGIVAIDYDACIGCRYCITACPYSARTFDFGEYYGDASGSPPLQFEKLPSLDYSQVWNRTRDTSPSGNARKCTLCIHRVEQGLLPACVLSCMGRATHFGDLNDSDSLVSELIGHENVTRLKEDLGTNPKVYYIV
jgi:molybdopterin-containing oxidoreductase family iron-sulfur binding subunit